MSLYKFFIAIIFVEKWFCNELFPCQSTSGGAVMLKTGRREVPGSNLGRACRLSRSEFSVVFLRNLRKNELGSLRKTPTEGSPPIGPGPTSGHLALSLQPKLTPRSINKRN